MEAESVLAGLGAPDPSTASPDARLEPRAGASDVAVISKDGSVDYGLRAIDVGVSPRWVPLPESPVPAQAQRFDNFFRDSTEEDPIAEESAMGAIAPRLYLLGGFELVVDGRVVTLTSGLKRLLALLGVRRHGLSRSYVAGILWGDVSETRAHGSLRSLLSKLKATNLDLVKAKSDTLELSSLVTVDLHDAGSTARAVIEGRGDTRPGSGNLRRLLEPRMCAELLPGWYEDWVLTERERHRQLTLHALELLCEQLTAKREFAVAVLAGLAAVDQEPLRESAQRALIKAHLAEDNAGEAIRCYRRYESLAASTLGVDPSPAMKALLAGVATI